MTYKPYIADSPVGNISMWHGLTENIPNGWVLCDGTNGTPDLRDRFIVGSGTTYTTGNTGGATSHSHGANDAGNDGYNTGAGTNSTKNHLPPYYALSYIMKL